MSDSTANNGSNGSGASPCSSVSLLTRVQANETGAWDRLVGLYAPLVFGWCRRWGLPEQDAADVMQEVFQAVVSHLAGFRSGREGGTFRGWLRTIARHKVQDHFRRGGREPRGAGGSDAQAR